MKRLPLRGRTLALAAVLLPMLALLVYVALRSGPMAPVAVTLSTVENRALAPALFGIGTVEARYTYKIGPTFAGRVNRLEVQVGELVKAGQVLAEIDPVDLDQRVRGQGAALQRSAAQLREAEARQAHAQTQARRYQQLLAARSTSEEIAAARQQELQIAEARLDAAREELARVRAERAALLAQRDNLRLIAPVDGLVTVRNAEPGTTVVAGQAVVELIDPKSLWISARFDQIGAHGLQAGLPAQVVLRSRHGQRLAARVLRIEPLADAVTEETLAKLVLESLPQPLPPLGELAEVTVALPELAAAPLVPNASIQRVNGTLGVWRVTDGALQLAPVKLGAANLEGQVQVLHGVTAGDRVVTYSERALTVRSRIDVLDQLVKAAP